jgi:hypothetical protein
MSNKATSVKIKDFSACAQLAHSKLTGNRQINQNKLTLLDDALTLLQGQP